VVCQPSPGAQEAGAGVTEGQLVYDLRLALSVGNTRLFRINCGTFELIDGRFITVGVPGMSDLIGWQSRLILPKDVGQRFAIFTALEVKSERGRATPEQLAFIETVRGAGGLAGVVRSLAEAETLLHY
jgi:VRR-NUC domain